MKRLITWWNGTKLAKRLRDIRLSKKITAVYVIIVILPSILTAYLMNVNYYKGLWEKYCRSADDVFRSEVEIVEYRLNDVSKLSAHFTSNFALMDYMGTENMSVADSLYAYMKYFKTIFLVARSSSPYVNSVTVYTQAEHDFEMSGELEDLKEGSVPENVLESIKGRWMLTCENGGVFLNYYKPIYTTNYSKFLGVLKIGVDAALVTNCFTEETVHFSFEDRQFLIKKDGENTQLINVHGAEEEKKGRFTYICRENSEQLNGDFFTVVTMAEDFLYAFLIVLLPSFLMLLLLPLIYLGMMSRQIKRIEKLSEYISLNHTADPRPYQEKLESGDEIGTLIKVYNHSISEISRLSKEVALAELQRKDSEYYALQAQIKPHFLYNTLENIRMTAERENCSRTSAMLEILGNYMRYGMQKDLKYTLLTQELQHVKYYQKLMDIRFPGKIRLKISAFTDISAISCPYLLLQPIIENAIKHGMEPGNSIDIEIEIYEASPERKQRDVVLQIKNNGRKIPKDRLEHIQIQLFDGVNDKDGHVGLNNINFRLISCYGRDYYMRIDNNEESGCIFVIYLPARNV